MLRNSPQKQSDDNFKLSPKDIKNLVFQGGSIRGMAYVGALQALSEAGISLSQIERVAGSSAGAMTALAVSLGCKPEEIQKWLMKLFSIENFRQQARSHTERKGADFFTANRFFKPKKATKAAPKVSYQLLRHWGMISTDVFGREFNALIKAKTGKEDLTFAELKSLKEKNPDQGYKELYVTAANLSTGETTVFGTPQNDHAIIAKAVTLSMSIPFVFQPGCIWYKDKDTQRLNADPKGHIYVDGGVNDNCPTWIMDGAPPGTTPTHFNRTTLAFRLVDKQYKDYFEGVSADAPEQDIKSLVSFGQAMYRLIRHKENDVHQRRGEQKRTIYIDTQGIDTLNFNLSSTDKEKLIASGENAVAEFFNMGTSPRLGV